MFSLIVGNNGGSLKAGLLGEGDGDNNCDYNGLEVLWDIHLEKHSRKLDVPNGNSDAFT